MADDDIVKNAKLLAESFLDEEFTRSLKERLSAFDSEILDLNHNRNDVQTNEEQTAEILTDTAENFKVHLNHEMDPNVLEERIEIQLHTEQVSPINDESMSTNLNPAECPTNATGLSTVSEEETSCLKNELTKNILKEEPIVGVCVSSNNESQSNNATTDKMKTMIESNESPINDSEMNQSSMLNNEEVKATLEKGNDNPPIIVNGTDSIQEEIDPGMISPDIAKEEEQDEDEELEEEFKELKTIKITSNKHWWQMDDKNDENQRPSVDKFRTLKQIKKGNTRSLKERFESFNKQNKF